MRLRNLVGERFDRLVVLERVGFRGDGKKPRWKCLCDCGNTTEAYTFNLTRRYVTSCGCYRREFIRGNQLPDGVSGFNGLYSRYRGRAKKDDIPFELSKDEFRSLTEKNCCYCGSIPKQSVSSRNTGRGRYTYSGIDRVDSDLGYSVGNCVPCCSVCNYMKIDMTTEEFMAACRAVISYQEKRSENLSPLPSELVVSY